ncbi:unnamed protein product, partial [Laminaria digitata]
MSLDEFSISQLTFFFSFFPLIMCLGQAFFIGCTFFFTSRSALIAPEVRKEPYRSMMHRGPPPNSPLTPRTKNASLVLPHSSPLNPRTKSENVSLVLPHSSPLTPR